MVSVDRFCSPQPLRQPDSSGLTEPQRNICPSLETRAAEALIGEVQVERQCRTLQALTETLTTFENKNRSCLG